MTDVLKELKAVVVASNNLFQHVNEKPVHTKKEQRLLDKLEQALVKFAEEETL